MKNDRVFELRSGSKTWATLSVSDKEKRLSHSLDETIVMMCPGLMMHDENGRALGVKLGECLFLPVKTGPFNSSASSMVMTSQMWLILPERSGSLRM
jgi:hypothetical protein